MPGASVVVVVSAVYGAVSPAVGVAIPAITAIIAVAVSGPSHFWSVTVAQDVTGGEKYSSKRSNTG
jgi:hypothetical protein